MDIACQQKWDRRSRTYDWLNWGDDRRFAAAKRRLLARMSGRALMMAAGTGRDFQYFPSGLTITAVDISPEMVRRARDRAVRYDGDLAVRVMDAQALEFAADTFDTAVTVCTLCSVPDPLRALREIYRCLKPGGKLLLFEHVRSRLGPIALMQDMMTPLTRYFVGTEMNRETVANVLRAGFELERETNAYVDVVKAIEARRPSAPS